MKYLVLFSLLLVPVWTCFAQSPTPGTVLTFTIDDENLVTDHRGIMTLSTAGLVDFTIDGVQIPGPSTMVETGIDTGEFVLQLTLPSTINGRPLQNGDVVVMTYHQPADYAGNPETLTQSVTLSSIPTVPVQPAQQEQQEQSINIGQYYTLQLYAPSYNLDSEEVEEIPVNIVQVNMEGVQTTLADPAFQISPSVLRETGPNTNVFSVTFKIPQQIDGYPVEIGSTLEFTIPDYSQPVPSESSVFVRIGTNYQPATSGIPSILVHQIIVQTSGTGARVDFLNSTVLEGLENPVCFPSSSSFFPIGTTSVTCSATNSDGNSVLRSFSVIVNHENVSIPSWVKNLTGLWCNGSIQESDYATAIKFLNSSKIISVPTLQNATSPVDKDGICSWYDGKITDGEVVSLFYPLIQ